MHWFCGRRSAKWLQVTGDFFVVRHLLPTRKKGRNLMALSLPQHVERVQENWEKGWKLIVAYANAYLKEAGSSETIEELVGDERNVRVLTRHYHFEPICDTIDFHIGQIAVEKGELQKFTLWCFGRDPIEYPRDPQRGINDYWEKIPPQSAKEMLSSDLERYFVIPMREHADGWREWFAEEIKEEHGITIYDVAFADLQDEMVAKATVKKFVDSRKLKAKSIGKCDMDGRKKLYGIDSLLSDYKRFTGIKSSEIARIRRGITPKLRYPRK